MTASPFALPANLGALPHHCVALEFLAADGATLACRGARLGGQIGKRPLRGDDAGGHCAKRRAVLARLHRLYVFFLTLRNQFAAMMAARIADALAFVDRFGDLGERGPVRRIRVFVRALSETAVGGQKTGKNEARENGRHSLLGVLQGAHDLAPWGCILSALGSSEFCSICSN
jgi:hypothetical protein